MTPSQTRTIGLHAGTFLSGIVAAVSVMASSGVDIYSAYQHAYAGVRELLAAWSIVVPVLTIGFAAYKASTRQKLLDAVAAPDAREAARGIAPSAQVMMVADQLARNGH